MKKDDNDDDNGKGQRTKRSQTYQRDSSHSRHWLKGQENILTSSSSSSLSSLSSHPFFLQFFFSLCFALLYFNISKYICFCLVVFQYFKIPWFLPCCISIFQNNFIFAMLYFNISKYPGFCLVVFQYLEYLCFCLVVFQYFQNIFVFALSHFNISKYLCFCLVVFQYFKALQGIGFGDQVSLVGAGAASSLMVSAIMSKISSTNWLQSISSKNVLLKCYWILCEKPLKDISLMWQILHWCEGRSKS